MSSILGAREVAAKADSMQTAMTFSLVVLQIARLQLQVYTVQRERERILTIMEFARCFAPFQRSFARARPRPLGCALVPQCSATVSSFVCQAGLVVRT